MAILLDGMCQIYRANAKLCDLVTRDERHTGLEFGFLKSLEALKRYFKDDKLIVCWEGNNNFRLKLDPEYKANRRKKRAEGITTHEPLDFNRVNKFKGFIEMVADTAQHDELEADDVIANLAEKYCQTERVVIYSGDKDLLQLVRNKPFPVIQVRLYKYRENPWTIRRVKEKYNGLSPSQLATYFALVGDVSDNIPGVRRVRSGPICSAILEGYTGSNIADFELFSTNEIFSLEQHYESGRFDKNMKLVTLQMRDDIIVKKMNWQKDKITDWLNDMEFATLDICKECGITLGIREGDEF